MTFFRQLVVGVSLTVFNLLGALLTVAAIGGRGEWTIWQFVGLFGLLEGATGIAMILGPNAWQLPVRQAEAEDRRVTLSLSSLLIPHWAPGVKTASGFALMLAAIVVEGVGPATLGAPLLVVAITTGSLALSVLVARFGVARPDLDVLGIIVRRPGRTDRELPGMSVGALCVQILLNILTIPAVKLFPPTFLYQPEFGPSLAALGWSWAVATAFSGLALLAWAGRLRWSETSARRRRPSRAPAESRQEA
jgi:hypothetical protein